MALLGKIQAFYIIACGNGTIQIIDLALICGSSWKNRDSSRRGGQLAKPKQEL